MLPKKYRLKQKKDFNLVHKKGRFYSDKFLAIKLIKNNLEYSRFGFLVSLKISKKATKRNKVKRRLREVVRLKLKEIKPGFDIIFLTRPEIVEKNFSEINEGVTKVLKKARLL